MNISEHLAIYQRNTTQAETKWQTRGASGDLTISLMRQIMNGVSGMVDNYSYLLYAHDCNAESMP